MPKRKRLVKVTDLIVEGLCRLVENGEKPFSELTVQDIVDEAGVCRNSFYRNYAEKDDIFRKQFAEMVQPPADAVPPARRYGRRSPHDSPVGSQRLPTRSILQLIKYARQQPP